MRAETLDAHLIGRGGVSPELAQISKPRDFTFVPCRAIIKAKKSEKLVLIF